MNEKPDITECPNQYLVRNVDCDVREKLDRIRQDIHVANKHRPLKSITYNEAWLKAVSEYQPKH